MLRKKTGSGGRGRDKVGGPKRKNVSPLLYFHYITRAFSLLPFFTLPSPCSTASQQRGRGAMGAKIGRPSLKGWWWGLRLKVVML